MPHKTVTIPTLPAKNLLPHLQYPKPGNRIFQISNIIENNITEHHYYRVKRKSARLSDTNVESPEQNCNKGKEKPVPPPLQIRRSSGINLIGRYQTAENMCCNRVTQENMTAANAKQKNGTLHEYSTYFAILPLAILRAIRIWTPMLNPKPSI